MKDRDFCFQSSMSLKVLKLLEPFVDLSSNSNIAHSAICGFSLTIMVNI